MNGWTRIRWSTRCLVVDGEINTVTIYAAWYVPLWLVHLWRHRRHIREIRARAIDGARAVAEGPYR